WRVRCRRSAPGTASAPGDGTVFVERVVHKVVPTLWTSRGYRGARDDGWKPEGRGGVDTLGADTRTSRPIHLELSTPLWRRNPKFTGSSSFDAQARVRIVTLWKL